MRAYLITKRDARNGAKTKDETRNDTRNETDKTEKIKEKGKEKEKRETRRRETEARGTVVKDALTGATLRDLRDEGEACVLVRGGEGGVGSSAFATAGCRRSREFTEGGDGKEMEVELELKTIADVGMVSASISGVHVRNQ